MVNLDIVKFIPHFSGLSPADLELVKRFIFERSAGKGELIVLEGEPAEALYFVISGVVKVFKTSPDGKEQILTIVRPRQSFNDVSVLDGRPNDVSAQAMTPAMLYTIKAPDLSKLLQDYPRVGINIAGVLAGQVRHLISLIEDLSFKNVLARVAKLLLEPAGDGTRPRLTQQDMAAMAGTAREMIGRSLKALESEGIIRMERHRIIIANKRALLEIAGIAR